MIALTGKTPRSKKSISARAANRRGLDGVDSGEASVLGIGQPSDAEFSRC